MNTETDNSGQFVWKIPLLTWLLIAVGLGAAVALFRAGIAEMAMNWELDEYSHGYMIPFIALFLLWQRKDVMERLEFSGSWLGVALIVLGVLLFVLGTLSAVIDIVSYGFVISIFGLAMAYTGLRAYAYIAIPLLILVFMIPVPGFLFETMSNQLQLISSKIGVAVIRAFDISVYLEGNVIDLGSYKLQVVEACSGLRYLFPLMTLGFIAAYFFQAALWKRIVLFLSTIPITVLMNSIRIGIIGVTVEHWGVAMAEGFLHDFEGWVIFMTCMVVLFIEMWLLSRIGGESRPLTEVFGLVFPEDTPEDMPRRPRRNVAALLTGVGILAVSAVAFEVMPEREDVIPERSDFAEFPTQFGEWKGRSSHLEQVIVNALNFDDYLMADYKTSDRKEDVNLYIGYYATQRADKVPHSPRACIPGGGWSISDMKAVQVDGVSVGGVPLQVNRLQIEKGEYKQVVYYWFQQRGRVVTNEWMVKLYLLVDSIRMRRTDGALVRITAIVGPDRDMEEVDSILSRFAAHVSGELTDYIPD